MVTYFNVYTKLAVTVWRIMMLFFWREKVVAGGVWIAFCFKLNIFTRFEIASFNQLGTKLISKNMILSLWKYHKKLKITIQIWKKNSATAGFLASFACFFCGIYNFFMLIWGLTDMIKWITLQWNSIEPMYCYLKSEIILKWKKIYTLKYLIPT